jgi:hypothetical protein
MKKVIEIKSCMEYPYKGRDRGGLYCEENGEAIASLDLIPESCPLPNAENKKEKK